MASEVDPAAQDEISARRAVLGRELRQRRQSLEITQVQLARQIGYSRSAVANAEIGYQHADRDFWERCDRALTAGGVLTSEHDEITALRQARTGARALAARSERDAKIAHRLGQLAGVEVLPERLVALAAEDSALFAQQVERSNVGRLTLEQFHDDIARIVQVYPSTPLAPVFREVLGLRDRVFELIDGHQHPLRYR